MVLDQKLALLNSGCMRALLVESYKMIVEISFNLFTISGFEVVLVILKFEQ